MKYVFRTQKSLSDKANRTRHHDRRGEHGNVFFTLFGAVAVVGVLGAGIMSTMRGPLSTMVQVNRAEQAKTEIRLNARLVLRGATNAIDGTGACDDDPLTEAPLLSTALNATNNIYQLPLSGGTQTDPWGTAYGYCAWNHGATNTSCPNESGSAVLLDGETVFGASSLAIFVVSAGPDKVFDTVCQDFGTDPDYVTDSSGNQSLSGVGDDIGLAVTYSDAASLAGGGTGGGGLWTEISGDASIARDLQVTNDAGDTNLLTFDRGTQLLDVGTGGFTGGAGTFADVFTNTLEANTTSNITVNDNLVMTAGHGITVPGTTDLNGALDVAGASTLNGDVTLGDAPGDTITINGTISDITVGNLTVNGNTTLGDDASADTITINGDTSIVGAGLNVTETINTNDSYTIDDDRVLYTDDGIQDTIVLGVGSGGALTTANDGANTLLGADVGNLLAPDGTNGVNNTLVGQNVGAAMTTGDDNTIVGQGSGTAITTGAGNIILGHDNANGGTALTEGDNNILIGNGLTVAAATTSDTLNIGNTITGTLGDSGTIDFDGNVTIDDDLTVSGGDIIMNNNTAGRLLIGQGASFQSVAASGDVHVAADGTMTIQNDAVQRDNLQAGGGSDGDCLKRTTTGFEWEGCSAGGGGDGVGLTGTNNQILINDGGTWEAQSLDATSDVAWATDGSDVALTIQTGAVELGMMANNSVGTDELVDDAVTYAKLQNVTATNRLLGRASAGAGIVEEITLGTGLSFSGTTLNVTGGTSDTAFRLADRIGADTDLVSDTSIDVDTAGDGTADSIVFETNGTDRMFINNVGKVGIGVAAITDIDTTSLVHMRGNNLDVLIDSTNDVFAGHGADLTIRRDRDGAIVEDGDKLGGLRFSGYDGAAFLRGAEIIVTVDAEPGTDDMPTRLEFFTNADGNAEADATPEMVIKNDGKVGIRVNDPATRLHIDGNLLLGSEATCGAGTFGAIRRTGETLQMCVTDSNGAGLDGFIPIAGFGFADDDLTDDTIGELSDVTDADGAGNILVNDGSVWVSRNPGGDVEIDGTGATTIQALAVENGMIADDAVTYAKLQNVTTGSVLLGRDNTGGGIVQEITLGAGLAMSAGGELSVTTGSADDDDLTNDKIAALQDVSDTDGTNNQILIYDTNIWEPQSVDAASDVAWATDGTDIALTIQTDAVENSMLADNAVNTDEIADDAVTYAKLQNVTATNRLLGRATAGAGVVEEITLGTGLSFTGTTLNVDGGATIDPDDLDFVDFQDAMDLDASTTITAESGESYVLTIKNEGSGNSFVVEDAAGVDSSPFVIDEEGFVGIGLSNPLSAFHFFSDTEDFILDNNDDVNNERAVDIQFLRGRAGGIIENGDKIGGIRFEGNDGAGSGLGRFSRGASIYGYVDGTPGNNDMPTRLEFHVAGDGEVVDSADTPEMVIKNSGNIGIGQADPDALLHVAGSIIVGDGGEVCSGGETDFPGALRYSGDAIQFCKDNGPTTNDTWVTLTDASASAGALNDLSDVTDADGAGNILVNDGTNWYSVATSGNVTIASNGAMTIADDAVTLAKLADITASRLIGTDSGDGVVREITLGTGLAMSAGGELSVSGGTAAGADTQIQYNTSNTFDASSDFTFNNTTKVLSVNGTVSAATKINVGAPSGTLDPPSYPSLTGDNLGNHIASQNIQLGANYLSGDGGNEGVAINADGDVFLTAPNAAPADGAFANSQWSLWLDEGNDEFELKAKKANGTVISQTVGGGADNLGNGTGLTANIQIGAYYITNDGDNEGMSIDTSGNVTFSNNILYSGVLRDTSDRRLKTNITPFNADEMIKKITAIDTYSFVMKDDESGRVEYGVMAQELEKIFPTLVHTADDEMGTKSVNYMGLIAPMIEATKALKAENEILKKEIMAIQTQQNEILQEVLGLKAHTGYGTEKAAFNMILILLMAMSAGIVFLVMRLSQKS